MAEGGGPTQRTPGRFRPLGELRVLGEEPEPGMDRVRAGSDGRGDHRLGIEEVEGVGAVGFRDHGADTEVPACPADAAGDLATIGDEHGPDGDRPAAWQAVVAPTAERV